MTKPFSHDDLYRFAAIVDSSNDAIISKSLTGTITSWNKAAQTIFGYSEDEAIGQPITLIFPEEKLHEAEVILSKIKNGEKVEHFETKRKTKSGIYIDVSITVSPIRNKKGNIIGASKIGRDISEQVKARQQLKTYTEELEKLSRHKDEFISMTSHELNTPVTSLTICLHLLREELTAYEPNVESSLMINDRAIAVVRKLGKRVKDLIDVSLFNLDEMSFRVSEFDINAMLKDVVEDIRADYTSHHIVVQSVNEPLYVWGDEEMLAQAFNKIICNAIKYSPQADKVIVTLEKTSDVVISITDFGFGIPASNVEHVFSQFFKAEGLGSSYPGLGISLFLAHQTVTGHNGKIDLQTEEGKGSTFTITLPQATNE